MTRRSCQSGCAAARCSSVRSVRLSPPSSSSTRDTSTPRQPRHRELAHRDAIVERRERLGERVLEGRHDEHAVDVLDREHERAREHVRDVRRVEAASEDRDVHGVAGYTRSPCTLSFAVRPVGERLACATRVPVGVVDASATTSSSASSSTIAPPPAHADGPGREKPARADLLDERPVALAVDEERRREDVLLVEQRLVVDEHRDAVAEHLDAAQLLAAAAARATCSRSRARSPRRNASICSGVPVAATANARSQTPSSLGSGPTSDSAQSADRLLERVVGAEVDGARDLGAVEQELRRARERRQVAVRGTEEAESHEATVPRVELEARERGPPRPRRAGRVRYASPPWPQLAPSSDAPPRPTFMAAAEGGRRSSAAKRRSQALAR